MDKGFSENSARVLGDLSAGLRDLVRVVAPGVVQVDAEQAQARSGIRYDKEHILTSAAYATAGDKVRVRVLTSGPGEGGAKTFEDCDGTVVGRDPATGFVLVHTEKPLTVSELPHRDSPVAVGELAVSVALPSYDGIEAKLGMVRCVGGPFEAGHGGSVSGYIQTDAALFPGFAGAPLVDMNGKMVGIHSLTGDGLIIPVDAAFEAGKRIAEHRIPVRGYLGVRSQEAEISRAQQEKVGSEQGVGLLVVSVETGSPAEKAGIVTGDILLRMAGQQLSSHEDLIRALGNAGIESPIDLQLLRGGEVVDVKVQLAKAPEDVDYDQSHHHRHGGPWFGPHGMRSMRRMRRWFTNGTAG